MAKINVLPKNVAELIAAGEVVERPASVIKELVENSIDAGADSITVEIQRGGVTYIRVTDNGSGISREDVPTAFLRHATSKIQSGSDLDKIGTLGFRGEALAAISSVAVVEMLTCTGGDSAGVRYVIAGGEEQEISDAGCPKGTTVIVRDLFYNTPARMKFLKTDVAESNAVGQVMDRIALSHPEIAVKFIRDGKQALATSGDGKLSSAIYSILGRDYHKGLIPAQNELDGVAVNGYVCKPLYCRPNRNGQFFFLNGRLVKSGTACAAVEQAYKNSAMVGKFPCCVLNIILPFEAVDVNVHPAKTEVRFTDERRVFNCIYYAVKSALAAGDTRPEITAAQQKPRFSNMTVEQFRQTVIGNVPGDGNAKPSAVHTPPPVRSNSSGNMGDAAALSDFSQPLIKKNIRPVFTSGGTGNNTAFAGTPSAEPYITDTGSAESETVREGGFGENSAANAGDVYENAPAGVSSADVAAPDSEAEPKMSADVIYIGEAFATYIIVRQEENLYIIDKHAAHERIIFERLRREQKPQRQMLLCSVSVTLTKNEYSAVIENIPMLEQIGFEIEDFGIGTVLVTAVPALLQDCDIKSVVSEIAGSIMETGKAAVERIEDIYHIVACRSAIKAGNLSSPDELCALASKVLSSNEIMYCPHGRPVAIKFSRREIEKLFGRIQ